MTENPMSMEFQRRFWFAWPFLLFGALVLGIGFGALWMFSRDSSGEAVEAPGSPVVDLERLLTPEGLRTAFLEANGGSGNFDALQSMRSSGVTESGGVSRPFFSIKRRPDQALLTFRFENHDLTFGVNGEVVWQRVVPREGSPVVEIKEGPEEEGLLQIANFFDPVTSALLGSSTPIQAIRLDEADGVSLLRVEIKPRAGGETVAWIDPETLQIRERVERFSDGRSRRVVYSDYRKVGGIWEPFRVETYLDGALESVVTVESSEHNVGTVPSLFAVPGEAGAGSAIQ